MSLYELLEQQAKKIPNNTAVIFRGECITYKSLIEKVNILADVICTKKNNSEVIGIYMERSIDFIISIFAILKSGKAFLPIDINYPKKRIEYMLNDSKVSLLISQPLAKHNLDNSKLDIININTVNYENKKAVNHNIECESNNNQVVYVIYTSGSSGTPKGVMVGENAVINFINGISNEIDFSKGKRIISVTSVSFDPFIIDSIVALVKGLTVVLADENERIKTRLLSKLIIENNVKIIATTPSLIQLILNDSSSLECVKILEEIIMGGEALSRSLLDELKKHTKAKIYNVYGPTEATIFCTIAELSKNKEINIGKPILNTKIHLMDENGILVKDQQSGEICISGECVAKGYINRKELTMKKFITSNSISGETIYKTGDYAKKDLDGNLIYLGRIDNQVKVGSYRIELDEIEINLSNYPLIKSAAVVMDESGRYICAYYSSKHEQDPADLNSYLNQFLPEYMIPSFYIKLDSMPLNSNGKIDKKKLIESDNLIEPYLNKEIVDDDIGKKVRSIISNNTKIVDFNTINFNSIDFMKIVIEIEKQFSFEFDDTHLSWKKFNNIESLIRYIKHKLDEKGKC